MFSVRFSIFKISTEHSNRQVALETVMSLTTATGKSFLFFIVTYLMSLRTFDLPGLTPDLMKHNFRNFWKSVSLTVESA